MRQEAEPETRCAVSKQAKKAQLMGPANSKLA